VWRGNGLSRWGGVPGRRWDASGGNLGHSIPSPAVYGQKWGSKQGLESLLMVQWACVGELGWVRDERENF